MTNENTETSEAFDARYHARNNLGASKRDTWNPCVVCGWSEVMAIHDPWSIGKIKGWAHSYKPRLSPKINNRLP